MVRTDAPSHEMVMSLLCSTAEKAHNQDLSALVTKVEEDPLNGTGFVKMRTFIEELILRLQKESRKNFVGLKGMGHCHGGKALVASPRRTAGGNSNNRFCFQ